jgi:hypothetical protein
MRQLLAARRAGESDARRGARAAWARANVSLDAAGERAASAVLAVLSGGSRAHD